MRCQNLASKVLSLVAKPELATRHFKKHIIIGVGIHVQSNDPAWAAGRLLSVEEKAAHYQALSTHYGLDKSGVGRITKSIRRNPDFKQHTNSAVAQKLGERALEAVRKKQFGKSKRARFKNLEREAAMPVELRDGPG